MPYVLLVLAFVINSAANILLKSGTGAGGLKHLAAGLLAFGVNVVFYALALRSLPLSVAYPVMVAGSFALVNGYSAVVFREGITPAQTAGYGFILIGVVLVLLYKRVA
jgi:multidrug transporter EmrE-like cation transporter